MSDTNFSPGFPIHSGNVKAFCCNIVINTPRRMIGFGRLPSTENKFYI